MASASGWHRKVKTNADRERQRKYDSAEHRAARAYWTPIVAAGQARCWRPTCRKTLVPGRWHVGHDDHQVTVIRGPECDTCNRKAGASKGARITNARRKAARFVRATR